MRRPRPLDIGTALVAALLVGCSALGYRPNIPIPSTNDCATNLAELQRTSADLESAYSWRAAYNRNAIYVGGILLLGTAAATGGLGAAGAATLSIALIAVSGTFVSSALALFNNAQLAAAYTEAEGAVRSARRESALESDCTKAYSNLLTKITEAANNLESARTEAAQAASRTELKNLQATVAVLAASPTVTAAPTATSTVVAENEPGAPGPGE
jgi:hypothetical protein